MFLRSLVIAVVTFPMQLEVREQKKGEGPSWCWQGFIVLLDFRIGYNQVSSVDLPVSVDGANFCSTRIVAF